MLEKIDSFNHEKLLWGKVSGKFPLRDLLEVFGNNQSLLIDGETMYCISGFMNKGNAVYMFSNIASSYRRTKHSISDSLKKVVETKLFNIVRHILENKDEYITNKDSDIVYKGSDTESLIYLRGFL